MHSYSLATDDGAVPPMDVLDHAVPPTEGVSQAPGYLLAGLIMSIVAGLVMGYTIDFLIEQRRALRGALLAEEA